MRREKPQTTEKNEREALLSLTALCARGEHCAYEMEEKMRRWGLGEEAMARVMEHLINNKYIDDSRYARAFALDKIRYAKWGRRKVEQALWAKRIDEATRREVLEEIGEEEYMRVLRPLVKSKAKGVKAANDYERNMKLARFALGRGFTMDEIRRCLDGADELEEIDEQDVD